MDRLNSGSLIDRSLPARFRCMSADNMSTVKYARSKIRLSVVALMLTSATVFGADSMSEIRAKGMIQPDGPPQGEPVRVDAGAGCVVDVRQVYIVKGTLTGSFDIDFRILVHGPCGHPPGTFTEEWIAHGNFVGSLEGDSARARFTYTATVEGSGEVSGLIVLGQGLNGELRIRGKFSDGKLSYDGQLAAPQQE